MSIGFALPLLDEPATAGEAVTACLRPLTGEDEALLAELGAAPPAVRTTRLLTAVTTRLGERAAVTPEQVRSLSVADRERLLLACVAANFGAEPEVVARCPAPDCGELAELSVSLTELLADAPETPRPREHVAEARTPNGVRTLRFRVPTGADQEAVAERALADPAAAASELAACCLLAVEDERGDPADDVPRPQVEAAFEGVMSALEPTVEPTAEAPCPACGRPLRTLLDGFALLSSGVASPERLYAEVDQIARTYHWSEAEILALRLDRRRRYLNLILAEVSP